MSNLHIIHSRKARGITVKSYISNPTLEGAQKSAINRNRLMLCDCEFDKLGGLTRAAAVELLAELKESKEKADANAIFDAINHANEV